MSKLNEDTYTSSEEEEHVTKTHVTQHNSNPVKNVKVQLTEIVEETTNFKEESLGTRSAQQEVKDSESESDSESEYEEVIIRKRVKKKCKKKSKKKMGFTEKASCTPFLEC